MSEYGIIGATGTATTICDNTNTAKVLRSGALDVYATPAMVALMEEAACNALTISSGFSGSSSVGIEMSIKHLAATSLGRSVPATATITSIKKTIVRFDVRAQDSTGSAIGTGTHARAIVEVENFMRTAVEKKDSGKL